MVDEVPVHPVQVAQRRHEYVAPQVVTMRAYEVHCYVYRPQEALVTGGCRGGFSAGELVAFLYARSFPKEEWSARFHEACRGMEGL